MKTEFKAKFLQHVAKKRKEEGFTLIELLVVIIIIGILSAIALPSFLSQANKAKQSEAKQYLASINKGQQAHYVEFGKFTAGISDLGLGIKTATGNYTYNLAVTGTGTSAVSVGQTTGTSGALNGYAGVVYLTGNQGTVNSESVLCENSNAAPSFGFTLTATTCAAPWKAL